MTDNLVQLQNNMKPVSNPFGFDFVVTWDKQPLVLKGDGKVYNVIGPLADHVAYHLYQKVWNQYHDEQVRKLKEANDIRGARRYRVPAQVEDKIWFMITGEHKHKLTDEQIAQAAADLDVLAKENPSFGGSVFQGSNEVQKARDIGSVSELVGQVREAGFAHAANSSGLDSAHASGSVAPNVPAPQLDPVAAQLQQTQEAQPSQPAPAQPEGEVFPGLGELQ